MQEITLYLIIIATLCLFQDKSPEYTLFTPIPTESKLDWRKDMEDNWDNFCPLEVEEE